MRPKTQGAPQEPTRATMSAAEVRRSLDQLRTEKSGGDEDPVTRLAWRPAWSIRSRRGAWRPFLDLFRRNG